MSRISHTRQVLLFEVGVSGGMFAILTTLHFLMYKYIGDDFLLNALMVPFTAQYTPLT